MRIVLTLAVASAASLLGAGLARAEALAPDYAQAPNGSGYEQTDNLTPAGSPIQLPGLDVRRTAEATTLVAHPYIASWVHDLVPVPSGTAVELRGAVRVGVPTADGTTLVVNPNGHCVFAGPDSDSGLSATALPDLRVDVPVFQLIIEPTLYQ